MNCYVTRVDNLRFPKTNSYLPRVIGDAKEVIAINEVNDNELASFWAYLNQIYYNRFICSADEEGLKRYERLLGIEASGDLEQRRRRVHYEWNKQLVYTDRSIRQLMTTLLGEDGFFMAIVYDKYTVRFEVRISKRAGVSPAYIKKELRAMIPANMWIDFGVYVEARLILETSFDQYMYRYVLSGERETGTIPWYLSRGIQYGVGIVVAIKDEELRNAFMMASDNTYLNRQTLNPYIDVDAEIIINDDVPYEALDRDFPVLESAQYKA